MLVSWYLKNKISLVIFPVWECWGMTWWFWLPLKSRKGGIHDVVEPENNKSALKNGREGWKHCRIQSRKPEDSFPKRSILEYQLSWMHCLLLCEYLDVRGRLFVSMPGLIKWDLSFLADRWSGCYTQTFDWPLAFGHSSMPLQHQVPVSHWQPGMGTALGDWRGGRCLPQ